MYIMIMVEGKERDLDEWEILLNLSGFKIDKIIKPSKINYFENGVIFALISWKKELIIILKKYNL